MGEFARIVSLKRGGGGDLGLRIVDRGKHGAWGIEHREIQLLTVTYGIDLR